MKKADQIKLNNDAIKEFNAAREELSHGWTSSKQLRSCSARVYETNNYYILQSYNTLIACINKNTNTLFDVLRIVYGYTATSAKHIAKFNRDYCQGSYGCSEILTAR